MVKHKQFVGNLPKNCLSSFEHSMGLTLKLVGGLGLSCLEFDIPPGLKETLSVLIYIAYNCGLTIIKQFKILVQVRLTTSKVVLVI